MHHRYWMGSLVVLLDRSLYFRIMDLTDPTRAMTPTLDGPVLAVLARAGKPLTAGEVAAQTPRGSEIGVRKCLARLVEQGIVRATEMGRNRVHELNREHLGAPIARLLADLRLELWNRFRKTLGTWNPKPVYGCVFGSAARGDGDARSDIDLLLVHAPLPGENDPRRRPERSGGGCCFRRRVMAAPAHGAPACQVAAPSRSTARACPWVDRQPPPGPGNVHVPVGRPAAAPERSVRRDQPRRCRGCRWLFLESVALARAGCLIGSR